MTINFTNCVSKDVDCATDDVRATVDFPIVSEFPVDEVAGHLIEVKGFNFTVDTKFEFVNDKGSVEATSITVLSKKFLMAMHSSLDKAFH